MSHKSKAMSEEEPVDRVITCSKLGKTAVEGIIVKKQSGDMFGRI